MSTPRRNRGGVEASLRELAASTRAYKSAVTRAQRSANAAVLVETSVARARARLELATATYNNTLYSLQAVHAAARSLIFRSCAGVAPPVRGIHLRAEGPPS